MVKWRIKRKRQTVLLAMLIIPVLTGLGLYVFLHQAGAWTGNNGTLAFGDGSTTSNTNRGRISGQAYTFGSPGTFATRFRLAQVVNSALQFVVNRAAPTRNEKMIGYQLNNGSLYIDSCISTCTTQTNLTNAQWNTTILGSSTETRGFDIAYEQLSGRAIVVYAGNTTGKLYYCIYDGTSWGPVSNCAPTNGTNDISLTDGTTTLTGTPTWVRLVPYGPQFGDNRSNQMLLAVQDSNQNIFVTRWTGSAWSTTDRQVLTTTGGATVAVTDGSTIATPAFDVGWESTSGLEMAVYANGTALNYRTSSGSGWSSATTIGTLATAAQWVQLGSDSRSNRMSLIIAFGSTGSVGSSATGSTYIWKTDGSTTGWTKNGTDLTMAQDAGQDISTVWLKANAGTPEAIFSASANANTQQPDWMSWTQAGGFGSWTALSTTSGDIIVGNELAASPNSDIVTMMQNDRDGKLDARTFSGASWGSLITTNMTTSLVNTTTGRTTNQTYTQKAYQFTYNPYSAWSLNWRVYTDYATAGTPTTPAASEDTEPSVATNEIVRLRVNVAELGGMGQTSDTNGVRKKLQYSSGAGCPDATSCTWTDVGASGSGSIWRYNTSGGLSDNTALTGSALDGTNTNGYAFTNGTASASNSIQAANTVEEYDYTLQNNGAAALTDYYFRVYDFGASQSGGSMTNLNALYREQIFNTAGTQQTTCSNGTNQVICTYPTLFATSNLPGAPVFTTVPSGTTTPTIQLSASDILNNYLQYAIEYCTTNSWPCSAGGGTFDETVSQSGWSGQDADGGLAYQGNANINNSTVANYTVSAAVFQPNTTYFLRARAYDPVTALAFGPYSSTSSLTTGGQEVLIQGGTNIKGGTTIQ